MQFVLSFPLYRNHPPLLTFYIINYILTFLLEIVFFYIFHIFSLE